MFKLHRVLKSGRLSVNLCRNFRTQYIAKINVWYPAHQVVDQLEAGYANFKESYSNSLLKKHLTQDIFDCLKSRRTSYNSTLLDCVQSGFANLDSIIGVYAPDPEAYKVFAELFDPIIEDFHGFSKNWAHPAKCFGSVKKFTDIDPYNMYVICTKIEARRSLRNFAFTPCLQIHQFDEIQNIISKVVCGLKREFDGKFFPLSAMDNEYGRYIKACGYLFDECDRHLRAANGLKGWPIGRGVYINDDKNFIIWINEEDHIRLFSKEEGGNIQSVYSKLIKAINMINMRIEFARNDRLGFLTACPSNLGNFIFYM